MGIRTFFCWYGRPDDTPGDEVLARYDVILGGGCPPERRRSLRKLNPNLRFVVYCNAIDVHLPRDAEGVEFIGTGQTPAPEHRHSRTSLGGDVWAHHREFLLANRAVEAADPRDRYLWGYQKPYDRTTRWANRFFLDPRTGWKDYYAELCARTVAAGGYDGVFCDNAGAHVEWLWSELPEHLRPDLDDAEWAAAMAGMLAGVARRLRRDRPGAITFANTCGDFVASDADGIDPTPFWRDAAIDGAAEEFFAHAERPGRESYVDEATWRLHLRSMLCCEKMRRAFLAIAQGPPDDHAARLFSLGSFLIGAGERSLFNYNPGPVASYRQVYRMPEWDIDLGAPSEQYERPEQALAAGSGQVYARRFARGLVLVNPRAAPAGSVPVPPRLKRVVLEGGPIGQGQLRLEDATPEIALGPHAAEILVDG